MLPGKLMHEGPPSTRLQGVKETLVPLHQKGVRNRSSYLFPESRGEADADYQLYWQARSYYSHQTQFSSSLIAF